MEIDISALIHNIKEIKRIITPETQMMAVVKADGYGHGAQTVGRIFLENGASWLGVATVQEACQLRNSGIRSPILILGHTEPGQADTAIEGSISQTISTWQQAVILSGRAVALSHPVRIHIKIDTGMGRLGFLPDGECIETIEKIMSLPSLSVEGIFTHFATSDSADKTHTQKQWHQFSSFLNFLEQKRIHIPIRHAANSAAIINHPQTHLDMVRAGIALYGLYPSSETNNGRVNLRPAMVLKVRVSHVKDVGRGLGLSYGRTYITDRKQRIATLPIGYADGFSRVLSNKAFALIHGQKVPVVGQICMDQCLVDVTGIDADVSMGDEVVLLGNQGEHEISADQWADRLGTINYEVITRFGTRIAKMYIADFRGNPSSGDIPKIC